MKKMMGLIYKDVIQMKASLIINFILDILFIVLSLISFIEFKNAPGEGVDIYSVDYAFELVANAISFMIVVIITPYTLVLNSVAIDEKSQFTRFILASGCSRTSIVNEKTLFGIFAGLPGIIFIISMGIILLTSGNSFITVAFTLGLILYAIAAILFLNAVAILYTSIFSSISNQAVGVIVFIIIAGLLFGGIFLGTSFIGSNNSLYFFYGASGGLLALSIASYFSSIKIYQNKDF